SLRLGDVDNRNHVVFKAMLANISDDSNHGGRFVPVEIYVGANAETAMPEVPHCRLVDDSHCRSASDVTRGEESAADDLRLQGGKVSVAHRIDLGDLRGFGWRGSYGRHGPSVDQQTWT